jgi:hypothetical protein
VVGCAGGAAGRPNHQTDDLSSTEVTPRIGLRLHVLSNLRTELEEERRPRQRLTDAEWFWPVDEPDERFPSTQRLRGGIGYRKSFAWRFEAPYVWDRSRDSANAGFTSSDQAFDLKVRRVW